MKNTHLSRFLWLHITLLISLFSGTAAAADNAFDNAMGPVADWADKIIFYPIKIMGNSLPIVLIVLGGTAVFLTIYLKFINIRTVGLALRTIKGHYTKSTDPGQITHFQAICASLSATVGLGNIAGVAVAVGVGGPGATFWMILMGLCGMTTKFVECTLGVKYRVFDKENHTHGGPMHYLETGLKEKGMAKLGKGLAIFFAIMCIGGAIGAGNMYQINQASEQFSGTFEIFKDDNSVYFGIIMAVIVGLVIIGGIKSIARVTSFLVPFMCLTYLLAALVILISNFSSIPSAFSEIFTGAFSPIAVGGGIVGVLIQGIQRAAFSNEAGVGSASIAHSAVKTTKPASEGYVAMLGPFIDTVVVCTMTALVLVISGAWKIDATTKEDQVALYSKPGIEQSIVETIGKGEELRLIESKDIGEGDNKKVFSKVWREDEAELWVAMDKVNSIKGIAKTSIAFERQFSWFPIILSIAAILFAFSTMISWSFYGEQAVNYLFGINNKIAMVSYKVAFCFFVVVGSAASLGNVLKLSDAMIFAMVIPNMIGIYILLPKVKEEIISYEKHVKEIDEQA